MQYIIDTANREQIEEVIQYGLDKVTANTTMYKTCNENLHRFLIHLSKQELSFLSGEVMGDTYEEMMQESEALLAINKHIVIKIDFSEEGLKVCHSLAKQGVKTAMTLVFTLTQAMAAIQAGADYIFAFIGRNEEIGQDGLAFVHTLQKIVNEKGYSTKVVAASIKHQQHLDYIMKASIDYVAIPYSLYKKALFHPLSESGHDTFKKDFLALK